MDRHTLCTRRTMLLTLAMCCMRNILAEVLINELNPDSPSRVDTEEFIELYNNGASPVSLDDYVIVLYDGATNAAYGVIYLQGDTISQYGYYVIGSSVVQPTPNKVFDSSINILENGLDAVALYHGTASQYEVEMSVTSENLVDAIVYDNRARTQSALIDVLTPNEGAVVEWSMHLQGQDESLSRCKGMDPRRSSQFQLSVLTPGAENNCIMEEPPTLPAMFPNLPSFPPNVADIYPEIVINEFSIDSSSGQFIELYDGGVGEMALDGLIIVTYRGRTEASYGNPISLTGHMTDENGYFLIGQAHQEPHLRLRRTLRTNQSPNAIALSFNIPSDFAPLTPVTGANLIDAVVYGAAADPQDSVVVSILSAGRTPLIQPVNKLNTSLSRCGSSMRLHSNAFKSAAYTPGRDNVCPLPDFFINEVNVATGATKTDQFVEIFDGGIGQQSLEGVALVLYNGANTKSYLVIDLSGFSTNAHGFCVVGWVNSTSVDVSVEFAAGIDFLQPGPNAVALHLGPAERFRRGTYATNFGLIDAVVYGSTPALDLLHILLPYQHVLNESGGSSSDSALLSISRCLCCQRLNSASFGIGPSTPGEINAGCIQNNVTLIETLDHYVNSIRINEIRISMQGLPRGDFVEISDGGFGGVPLANLVLVLYKSQGESSYKAIDLDGYQTDANGLFVIGPPSMQTSLALIDDNHWFEEAVGAVALHKGSAADFPTGTRASSSNLVDAIAFGDENLLLIDLLTPGQSYISYTISTGENSIIRCYSRDAHDILAYTVGTPSPGVTNDCPSPPIFINEVNVLDVSSDVGQYVELSSGSIPHFPLHSLLLIFWDGTTSLSYRAVGINGKRTDENGFFLIGYRGMSAPHPDMIPFITPTGRIREGSNAISLHLGLEKKDYPNKTPLTKDKLVDVIVHGLDDSSTAQHLIDFFKPRAQQINEDTTWSDLEESINLCVDANNTVYQLAHITPKAPNHCPSRPEAKLIINELNLIPSEQFIELWDLGAGFTSLDDFVVVLFGEGDVSYWSIPLTGFTTDSRGYFVMGAVGVQPRPQFLFADGFMRHTYGAVALYRASSAPSFPDGKPPSSQGLIDAIVYTDLDINPASLTAVLTPRNSAVNSTTLQTSGFSLSRCLSIIRRSRKPFLPRLQSPKSLNDCPVYFSDVVINEINVEHPGQSTQEEFIELYDGGVGNVRMQFLSLVLFNGHYGDRAYLTLDLHGRRTDSNGYFVIGGQNAQGANLRLRTRGIGGFLQAGPDAVALYRAPPGAFPRGSEATTISLVDAVVYSTDESQHVSLVDKLIPGGSVVLEDANHVTGDKTISRCHGNQRLNSDVYTMGWPTPGKANNCSSASRADHSSILISEVKVKVEGTMGGEFIELYDGGVGAMSLNGLLLVLFNGANQDRSYMEIDLNGYSTNAQGFFVVGTSDITPSPDLVVPNNFLQNGPDAVVVYSAPARLFPRGTIATSINMVDVIVYTSTGRDGDDSTLLNKLVPGQRSVSQYGAASDGEQSLSRCLSNHSWTLSAFTVSRATPGFRNVCPPSSVVISEIKLNGASSVAFIELYDGGLGSTPLDALSLVLFDASHSGVRAVQSLQGQSTNSNGYFLYGKPSTEWAVDLEISASFANFKPSGVSSAVALYKDKMSGQFASDSVLLDAVVYGSRNPSSTVLIDTLLGSGQKQVQTSPGFSQGETSISRCVCCMPLMSDVFDLTSPTPGQENICIVGTTLATPSDIIINEVSPWFGGWEYVELRGPPGARLDSLSLVLAKSIDKGSPRYYFALSLDRRAIAADGIFLIGSSGVGPPPDALLPQSAGGVLRRDEGAVAIYRNSASLFGEGVPVTKDALVDAIVYTNVSSRSSSELGSILTPGFSSIYTSNFSSIGTVAVPSISRCTCCDSSNPSSFTLSAQTPGMPNRCPSSAYKTTIQMHILDAGYEVWVTNPQFTSDLRKQIVSGINAECKCGFNENYLRGDKLLNGSVYYQVDVLAISSSHAKLLYDSYTQFVSKMDTLKILGTDFHIDNKCFSNCSSGGDASKPEGMTGGSGSTATVVAVVVVAVVTVAIIGVALFVYLRHRRGSLSFWKNRKDANDKVDGEFNVTNLRTLNDFDVLGTVSETRTPTDFFSNPVYMYEPPRAAVTHPEPPVSVGVKGEKANKEEMKADSVRTNGASATETKRV